MKNQTINLKYSLAKSRALSHYLEKEGKTIEGELLDHIDRMYDAQVPEVVREFVASQNPEETHENARSMEPSTEKSSRPGSRKKQTQNETDAQTMKESGPVLTM